MEKYFKRKRWVARPPFFLFLFVLTSSFAYADWKKDYEVDQKIGLLQRDLSIDRLRIYSENRLAGRVDAAFQPYRQQPEDAQVVIPAITTNLTGQGQ